MRFLLWIIGLPIAVAAVLFAISNRHMVRLELWPLPFAIDLPVYVAVLGGLAIGLILGMVITWLASGRYRRQARKNRRRAEELERQVQVLRQPAPETTAQPPALLVSGNGAPQP